MADRIYQLSENQLRNFGRDMWDAAIRASMGTTPDMTQAHEIVMDREAALPKALAALAERPTEMCDRDPRCRDGRIELDGGWIECSCSIGRRLAARLAGKPLASSPEAERGALAERGATALHSNLVRRLRECADREMPADAEESAWEDVPEITWQDMKEIASLLREAADALGERVAPPQPQEPDHERLTMSLWQAICELPDRNSPEDEPDAAVVTLEELRLVVANVLDEERGSPPAPQSCPAGHWLGSASTNSHSARPGSR